MTTLLATSSWHYTDITSMVAREPIYEADKKKQFANTHAPTLFTLLLNSITNRNKAQRKERHELQRQRTVALVHIVFIL